MISALLSVPMTTPPELITGLTDLFNVFFALFFWLKTRRTRTAKALAWRRTMLLLTISNLAGAVIHCFDFPALFDKAAWVFMTFILCLTVAMFAVCAEFEKNAPHPKRAYPLLIGSAVAASVAMVCLSFIWKDWIKIYVAYAAVVLLYAMGVFGVLAFRGRRALFWHTAALLVQIPGGIIQARRTLVFTLVWTVDYNTVYHLILTLTMALLLVGYEKRGREANTPVMARKP